jgi:hypothetical protein
MMEKLVLITTRISREGSRDGTAYHPPDGRRGIPPTEIESGCRMDFLQFEEEIPKQEDDADIY